VNAAGEQMFPGPCGWRARALRCMPMALTAAKVAEREPMELRRVLVTTSLTPYADPELDELTGKALQMIGDSPRLEHLVRSLLDLDFGLPARDLICSRSGRRRRVCHVGRVTYGWTTVRALDLERVLRRQEYRLRHHFGASAPAVLAAIASAHENFASQLRHPSGAFYEPQLVESLRLLEAALGTASREALLATVLRRPPPRAASRRSVSAASPPPGGSR
jgi:hypothetical protein